MKLPTPHRLMTSITKEAVIVHWSSCTQASDCRSTEINAGLGINYNTWSVDHTPTRYEFKGVNFVLTFTHLVYLQIHMAHDIQLTLAGFWESLFAVMSRFSAYLGMHIRLEM